MSSFDDVSQYSLQAMMNEQVVDMIEMEENVTLEDEEVGKRRELYNIAFLPHSTSIEKSKMTYCILF